MSDIALDEKRVYAGRREETVAYVASAAGVATVSIAGGQVGRFSLARTCDARDVAGADGRLAVATSEDVLVGTDEGFEPTGFGPAVAVGIDDGPVAAGTDGRIARLRGGEWETLGAVESPRALDGDLLAAGDGVHRLAGDGLACAGLTDAHDVSATGLPLAATERGLYYLGNGWMEAHPDPFATVCSDGRRAHAVAADGRLFERDPTGETYRERSVPVAGVVDLAYADPACAVTADGTVLVDADADATADGTGGWRTRSLGLDGVTAIAIP